MNNLYNILKKFKISEPLKIASIMYRENSILCGREYSKFNINQCGGLRAINFYFEGKKYTFDYLEENDRYTFSINTQNTNMTCIMIFIDKQLDYAYIENISYYDDCPNLEKLKKEVVQNYYN